MKEAATNTVEQRVENLAKRLDDVQELLNRLIPVINHIAGECLLDDEAEPSTPAETVSERECNGCKDCNHCGASDGAECSIDAVRTDAGNVRIMKVGTKHFVELQTAGQGTIWCPIVKVKGSPCLELIDTDLMDRNEDIIEALGLSAAVLDVRNTFADRLMKKFFLY